MPIPIALKDNLNPLIRHYYEDIYILEVGLSIFAFRHNYLIDQIQLNSTKQNNNNFITSFSNNTFLHFDKSAFDHFQYTID